MQAQKEGMSYETGVVLKAAQKRQTNKIHTRTATQTERQNHNDDANIGTKTTVKS